MAMMCPFAQLKVFSAAIAADVYPGRHVMPCRNLCKPLWPVLGPAALSDSFWIQSQPNDGFVPVGSSTARSHSSIGIDGVNLI